MKRFRQSVCPHMLNPRGYKNCRLRSVYSSGLMPYLMLLCISKGLGNITDRNAFNSSQMTMRPVKSSGMIESRGSTLRDSMRLSDQALIFHIGSGFPPGGLSRRFFPFPLPGPLLDLCGDSFYKLLRCSIVVDPLLRVLFGAERNWRAVGLVEY